LTVIATIITSRFCVHATDSFLTRPRPDGTYERVEAQKTKIVAVPAWRGAVSYWGLAAHDSGWRTLKWLQEKARAASTYSGPEDFALSIASELTDILRRLRFRAPRAAGLGLHFTSYEHIDRNWIPELFHIRNWSDTTYSSTAQHVAVTRETYGTVQNTTARSHSDRDPSRRLAVRDALGQGVVLTFNNGDPVLYNPIASSLFSGAQQLVRRRHLRNPSSLKTHLSLARLPIEVVSRMVSQLSDRDMRLVGGKPHDLAISRDGRMWSSTGDA
jgi:hypothetical protein